MTASIKKYSMFNRFIAWIKGKFRKLFSCEMYVMTLDGPSEYTGTVYPRYIIERELEGRPKGMPFYVHVGRDDMMMNLRGFAGRYPIFENSQETAIGTVDNFRIEGNKLFARMTLLGTGLDKYVRDMVMSMGAEQFRMAPAGCGDVADNVVQGNYHLETFDLRLK